MRPSIAFQTLWFSLVIIKMSEVNSFPQRKEKLSYVEIPFDDSLKDKASRTGRRYTEMMNTMDPLNSTRRKEDYDEPLVTIPLCQYLSLKRYFPNFCRRHQKQEAQIIGREVLFAVPLNQTRLVMS
nr:uncharacterized protein LOC121113612 [Lepeophtheirus salmonis]